MLTILPLLLILSLFIVVAGLGFIDQRKKRSLTALPPLSFMVPCYNDADSVGQTIDSIYAVCGTSAQVIVIDDCSTDGSREKLKALAKQYGFKLILNPANMGKSKTLNTHFPLTENRIVVFVDADVIVNRQSLTDALARLQHPEMGAVSCPYRAANTGFIPLMQTIEYNMLTFVQGAYNVFSAIALWGGFIAVKREAFLDAGKFSVNAITEDMDLAFKLNQKGWQVNQSFCPIRTYVPDTISKWFRQKIRWSSGGFQCFINYYNVWLKNPLHLLFVFSFCLLFIFSTLNLFKNIFRFDDMINYFIYLNRSESIWLSLQLTSMLFGTSVLKDLILRVSLSLFSLPFVLPLVSTIKQMPICLLVIPFSIFYVPLFSMVSMVGVINFLHRRRFLKASARAW
ncbi:glycosyltransferase, family II [Desulfosarcina variabilis str. Montpellier]|uniref:glycosyltransferase n=1 Tax=Desulfosarcina variabilis TaxID=2300 RepID=UPI003AFA4EAA